MSTGITVIVCARDEAERLLATLAALAAAFGGARVLVADDASRDGTAAIARAAGAEVVSAPRRLGKGGAATLAAQRAGRVDVVVLCDADLGGSAAHLVRLADAVRGGEADLAVGAFSDERGRRLRARAAVRALGGATPLRARAGRPDLRPARAVTGRAGGGAAVRTTVRDGDRDDGRRRTRRAARARVPAAARPSRHRAWPARLPAPRAPARRLRRGLRGQPPARTTS